MSDDRRLTHDEVVELAAAFVLGALEPAEEDAVREHLRACREPHAEFAELGSVVPALAEAVHPVEPPADLKSRILGAAADELAARRPAASPVAEPIPFETRRRGPSPVSWFLVAAAGIAIVALVASNLLLLGRASSSEQFARDVAAVLEAGSQPGAVTAVLVPSEPGGPRGLAAVSPSGELTMAVQDLEPTQGGEVYEGWAIVGDAAPVPIGGFTVGSGGTGRLDGTGVPVEAGMKLALTREPAPGATTPTLPILAAGTTGAPAGAHGRLAGVAP